MSFESTFCVGNVLEPMHICSTLKCFIAMQRSKKCEIIQGGKKEAVIGYWL